MIKWPLVRRSKYEHMEAQSRRLERHGQTWMAKAILYKRCYEKLRAELKTLAQISDPVTTPRIRQARSMLPLKHGLIAIPDEELR